MSRKHPYLWGMVRICIGMSEWGGVTAAVSCGLHGGGGRHGAGLSPQYRQTRRRNAVGTDAAQGSRGSGIGPRDGAGGAHPLRLGGQVKHPVRPPGPGGGDHLPGAGLHQRPQVRPRLVRGRAHVAQDLVGVDLGQRNRQWGHTFLR